MYRLKINITRNVLQRSAICETGDNARNCAIALAVRDIFPAALVSKEEIFPFLNFKADYIYIGHLKGEPSIVLPESAQKFINDFDNSTFEQRVSMDELSFEIEISDDIIDLIRIKELKTSTVELTAI